MELKGILKCWKIPNLDGTEKLAMAHKKLIILP